MSFACSRPLHFSFSLCCDSGRKNAIELTKSPFGKSDWEVVMCSNGGKTVAPDS